MSNEGKIVARIIDDSQKIATYGIDQVVELTFPVTTDSKTVADKDTDKCAYEVIENEFYLHGQRSDYLLSFLISLVIFLMFVVLIEHLSRHYWFL